VARAVALVSLVKALVELQVTEILVVVAHLAVAVVAVAGMVHTPLEMAVHMVGA
jgi:hypothetical protein